MPDEFNQRIIEEFRAGDGRVGGAFADARLLLLTTTGTGSGKPHTIPLQYLPDGQRKLVIASAAGAGRNPDWFRNLVAEPRVRVEDGLFTYNADATVLDEAERARTFARAVEADPAWADYQAATGRVIPVVALHAVDGELNASSWGAALKLVHDAFRRELRLVRKEVAESGNGLGAQLKVNCLTVCQGLHYHHQAEDAGMFPGLAGRRPDLSPTLDRLRREHETIAGLVETLQRAISAADTEPTHLLAEVDRLTEELESHLSYEEEQLVPLLDAAS